MDRKPADIESRDDRPTIFKDLERIGQEIVAEYGLEPDQIEVNTTPTASTWVVNFYIKDVVELRRLLDFMRDNDMLAGFE